MSARTTPRSTRAPHKPQKQQKPEHTPSDLERNPLRTVDGNQPQKSTEPPQKPPMLDRATITRHHTTHFCGTSRGFCGDTEKHPKTAGQQGPSPVSADSAVSAAGYTSRADALAAFQNVQALTVTEVMVFLRFSRPKVYDLIRSGQLRSFKEGRSRRIPLDALTAYMHNKMEEAA